MLFRWFYPSRNNSVGQGGLRGCINTHATPFPKYTEQILNCTHSVYGCHLWMLYGWIILSATHVVHYYRQILKSQSKLEVTISFAQFYNSST